MHSLGTTDPKASGHSAKPTQPKRLSAKALVFLYLGLCLLPLLLALGQNVAQPDLWERVAAAMGMVALVAMAIQFVTSGRFKAVSGRLGIDKVMAFHKIAARWVLIFLILHPLAYVFPTWSDDPTLGLERLTTYLSSPHYRSGVVAILALLVLVTSSILRNRLPWRYEFWRATHLLLGLLAVGSGLHHAITTGRFSAIGAVHRFWWGIGVLVAIVMLVLYVWRGVMLHRQPWQLASVTKIADRMWELDIQPAKDNQGFQYAAGQFVWMTKGQQRFPLFDHPFSLADSPKRHGLNLIIKEAGDFTNQIGKLVPGTAIGIDGPYGEFTLSDHQGDGVLLLAGGVGIAPIMGLLRDLLAQQDPRPIRLAYSAGSPSNFACLPEIEAARKVLDLQVMLISEEDAEGWEGLVGRLSQDKLSDLLTGLNPRQTLALICGPGPMVTAVSDALLDLGLPMNKVIYERFDYAGGTSRQDRRSMLNFLTIGAALAAAIAAFALFG